MTEQGIKYKSRGRGTMMGGEGGGTKTEQGDNDRSEEQ